MVDYQTEHIRFDEKIRMIPQYDYTAKYTMFPWDSPYDEDGNLVPDRYSGWVDSSDLNYLNCKHSINYKF